jgi:hypothetical protein
LEVVWAWFSLLLFSIIMSSLQDYKKLQEKLCF